MGVTLDMIAEKQFKEVSRGYDRDEVDAFLDEIMDEMEIFLKHVDSPGTIFRTNHASNYVLLAGTLNEDIPEMLEDVRQAREAHRYRRFRETGDLL